MSVKVRERVLCQEEFESLLVHCTALLKGLVLIALSTDETRRNFESYLGGDRSQNEVY